MNLPKDIKKCSKNWMPNHFQYYLLFLFSILLCKPNYEMKYYITTLGNKFDKKKKLLNIIEVLYIDRNCANCFNEFLNEPGYISENWNVMKKNSKFFKIYNFNQHAKYFKI